MESPAITVTFFFVVCPAAEGCEGLTLGESFPVTEVVVYSGVSTIDWSVAFDSRFSSAAFVSQSKSTELCSSVAVVRPQSKFTEFCELCSSATVVSESKS